MQREDHSWGVQLTVRPFQDGPHRMMAMYAEISHPKPRRGCPTRITFSAALPSAPLKLVDARLWQATFTALLEETQRVVAELSGK